MRACICIRVSLSHRLLVPRRLVLTQVLETAGTYDEAVLLLGKQGLVDEVYYAVAGSQSGQGAVVTRGRDRTVDVWRLGASSSAEWFRVETNYDHWQPVPAPLPSRARPRPRLRRPFTECTPSVTSRRSSCV